MHGHRKVLVLRCLRLGRIHTTLVKSSFASLKIKSVKGKSQTVQYLALG